MKWEVRAANPQTGDESLLTVDAASAQEAQARINKLGLLAGEAVPERPPSHSNAVATKRKHKSLKIGCLIAFVVVAVGVVGLYIVGSAKSGQVIARFREDHIDNTESEEVQLAIAEALAAAPAIPANSRIIEEELDPVNGSLSLDYWGANQRNDLSQEYQLHLSIWNRSGELSSKETIGFGLSVSGRIGYEPGKVEGNVDGTLIRFRGGEVMGILTAPRIDADMAMWLGLSESALFRFGNYYDYRLTTQDRAALLELARRIKEAP